MKNSLFLLPAMMLLVSLALNSVPLQAAEISFTNNPSDHEGFCYPQNSFGNQLGDFNGDGYLDIVEMSHTGSIEANKHCIWINDGHGKFVLDADASAQIGNRRGTACNWTAQIVDVNGDGLPEIYCRSIEDQDFYLNQSTPAKVSFKTLSPWLDAAGGYDHFYLADVNGDGNLDRISALGGDLRDTVSGNTVLPAFKSTSSDFYDLNNDSYPDLVNFATQEIYKNEGGISYTLQNTDIELKKCALLSTYGVDYDKDGFTDLLCVKGRDGVEQDVYVLRNNGNFSFTSIGMGITDIFTISQTDYLSKGSIAVADFDNNGLFDIYAGTDEIRFYQQVTPGNFVKSSIASVWPGKPKVAFFGWGMQNLDFGDINLDGKLDVLAGPAAEGSNFAAYVLLNNTKTPNKHVGFVLRGDAMGKGNNVNAIGARIVVKAAGTQQILGSHLVGNSWKRNGPNLVYHMGVGEASLVDVEIYWPSGFQPSQTFTNVNTGVDYKVQYVPDGDDNISVWMPGGFAEADAQLSPNGRLVFQLAESLYPGLFAVPSGFRITSGYIYKFYSATGTYLGIRNDMVYLTGGAFGNTLTNYGPLDTTVAVLIDVNAKLSR